MTSNEFKEQGIKKIHRKSLHPSGSEADSYSSQNKKNGDDFILALLFMRRKLLFASIFSVVPSSLCWTCFKRVSFNLIWQIVRPHFDLYRTALS